MKNENIKVKNTYGFIRNCNNEELKELLKHFSSEQLLKEVHNRNDIFMEGWYNIDDINNNTELPEYLCKHMIKYCNDNHIFEPLEDAIDQWSNEVKEQLEECLAESIAERYELTKEESDLFADCVQVDYDVELGFTPTLERPASEFAGTTFWDSSSDLVRKLTEICKPHQGNIKTYLEEVMQEIINEYFS